MASEADNQLAAGVGEPEAARPRTLSDVLDLVGTDPEPVGQKRGRIGELDLWRRFEHWAMLGRRSRLGVVHSLSLRTR